MTRPYSDATLDALADARVTHPCDNCGKPFLEGYPHRHETPVSPGYDPMPLRPVSLPGVVALIRSELIAELPPRLHVHQVPSNAEPIGVSQYSAEAAGWVTGETTMEVLDTGALGSPPWSWPFHRYIGSYRFWEGEVVRADEDLSKIPWTRNLEGVRRWCAGKHRTWYEHRGQPLCWTLLRHVVLGGYSVGRAGALEHIGPEKALTLFQAAIDKLWIWTSEEMNGRRSIRVKPKSAA